MLQRGANNYIEAMRCAALCEHMGVVELIRRWGARNS
jgi:hypothetical protein